MRIERVVVEEGFLDGMSVELSEGLNVVIGARGTGKTSLIELIRFCLDARGYTPDTQRRSMDHARSVLGSGQVTVVLADGARRVSVSRTAGDEAPRATGPFKSPIIFSQTEIESVGLHAAGRLRLLDGFLQQGKPSASEETSAIAALRSLSAEVAKRRADIEESERQLSELASIENQIAALAPRELQLSQASAEGAQRKAALDSVTQQIAQASVSQAQAERLRDSFHRWQSLIASAVAGAPARDAVLPKDADERLISLFEGVDATVKNLASFEDYAKGLTQFAASMAAEAASHKIQHEATARNLRKELESLSEGAGAVAIAGQQLRERRAQLQALAEMTNARKRELSSLVEARREAQDRLSTIREELFIDRHAEAQRLSAVLGPRIRITVSRGGQFESYANLLCEVLKGSGLKYSEIANEIAQQVSPAELVDILEANDARALHAITGISTDRCARAIMHLRASDLGTLATVSIPDSVTFQLLDGSVYKDIGELSTGQRCTVVLPMVLQHTDRVLIVDQPEDHIDNAFIADTLIKALLSRGIKGQTLFSTHNANIPVLGNAGNVIELGSDGRRGFVVVSGKLEAPDVVKAITTIMEGGERAFEQRARFYSGQAPA